MGVFAGLDFIKDALNIGYDATKTKTSLRLCVGRIKLLKNKKSAARDALVRDVVDLLTNKKHAQARVRVESVVRDERTLKAFEVLEILCEQLIVRLPLVSASKELPDELREPIASVIYAAKRALELPELASAKQQFGRKYGKDFAKSCDDDKTAKACGAHPAILDALKVRAVDDAECVTRLEIIATANGLEVELESKEIDVAMDTRNGAIDDGADVVYKDAMEAAAAAESAAQRAQRASEAAAALAGVSRKENVAESTAVYDGAGDADVHIDDEDIEAVIEEVLATPDAPETTDTGDIMPGPPPGVGGAPPKMSPSAAPFIPKPKSTPATISPTAAAHANAGKDDSDDLSKRFQALKR